MSRGGGGGEVDDQVCSFAVLIVSHLTREAESPPASGRKS